MVCSGTTLPKSSSFAGDSSPTGCRRANCALTLAARIVLRASPDHVKLSQEDDAMHGFHKFTGAMLVLGFCAQATLPGWAQTTVLTGRASTSTYVPQLVPQQPRYEIVRPVPVQSGIYTINRRPQVRTVYVRDHRTFFQRHPKVRAAAIGAGVGAGAGALTGLVTGHGVLRGAAIGAGAGAGVGLIGASRTMRRHPILKDVAMGSVTGLGIGAAASHGSRRALQGAGIGAAVGLGVGLLKHGL